MGNKSLKNQTEDQKSNSSVFNSSLNSNKSKNSNPLIKYNELDTMNELKEEVILPIENEYIESSEILLDKKEEELKIKLFIENKEENIFFNKKRSKTFMPKISIKNTPKPHPIESDEYISPLKLSIKSYKNIPKLNSVLYDFEKNLIDSRSCNDEDSFDDIYLYIAETERTTPNVEDLQNLLDCRKKMTIFRNSLNERFFKEYENILNSDYIFDENKDFNKNNYQQKKNNFWYKHIKQQRCENTSCEEEEEEEEEEDKKDHGLFILGILESAANERKRRNTVNV